MANILPEHLVNPWRVERLARTERLSTLEATLATRHEGVDSRRLLEQVSGLKELELR